jgi:hypothetical protein
VQQLQNSALVARNAAGAIELTVINVFVSHFLLPSLHTFFLDRGTREFFQKVMNINMSGLEKHVVHYY